MMKRLLSLILAVGLIFVMALPASAAEESAWIELLEYSTVDDSGSNWFNYTSTATVSIPTPYSMRCTKVDLLITYPANTAPSKVEVVYGGTYYPLEMLRIDDNTSRVFGTIQNNFYSDVRIRFTRSSSASSYLEILSCRVSQLVTQEVVADAQVFANNTYYPISTNIEVLGDDDPKYANLNSDATIRIDVQDWMKFDTLTIWGSASSFAISSIRVNVGTLGVPFSVSYLTNITSNEWSEWVTDYGGDTGAILSNPHFYGKTLYCINIDLSQLDRTYNYNGSSYPMYVYLTGTFPVDYGYTFNCQYVNGCITIPDKTAASLWNRFTSFMSDLFGGNSSDAEDFASDMESQATEAEDLIDELEQVTKPSVGDIDVDLSDVVSGAHVSNAAAPLTALLSNELFLSMTMISLTLALVAYVLYGKR